MDNLYLKVWFPNPRARSDEFPNLISAPPFDNTPGQRYITRVTLEGDGQGPAAGLWADSDFLIEDAVFSRLGGRSSGIGKCSECRSALISKAQVTVHNTRFLQPLDEPGSLHILTTDGGNVLIERSTFEDAEGATVRLEKGVNSQLYTDAPQRVRLQDVNGQDVTFSDLDDLPESERFLRGTDPWLTNIRRLLGPGGAALQQEDGGSSTLRAAIIGGICAAAVLAIVVAAVLVVRRRRKNDAAAQADKSAGAGPYSMAPAGSLPHSYTGSQYGTRTAQSGLDGSMQSHASSPYLHATGGSGVSAHNSVASSAGAASGYPSKPFSSMYVRSGTFEAPTITETFDSAAMTTAAPPSVDAPLAAKLDYLHSQLNQFGKDDVLLGRFTLLGETQRRQGGQGVVAFAVGAVDRLEYAIKFFVVHSSYIAERQLYESRVLGSLLPKIEDVYDPNLSPSRLLDRHGRPLPPCIVMERGESLNEWSRRAKPDVFQSVAVMAHVATRLRDMHKAGYVHRDIKPSNIMLLPRENRWTVIDFGSAAEVGAVASLSYTLVYASPEVAEAGAAGVKTIVADPAIDAWALGVVAFELLTGTSTFDMLHDGKQAVIAQLRGQQELPWEGERLRSRPDLRKRLGVFKNPVLALLQRDPVRRASMEDFCSACNSLFSGPTTAHAT